MKNASAFLLLIGILLGCASSKVKSEWNGKTDLKQYKSFRFIDSASQQTKQQVSLIDNTIHKRIKEELEKRDMKEGSLKPVLLISYHTYTNSKRDTINNHYPMMYGGESWRYYPRNASPYPFEFGNRNEHDQIVYTEGTLIIDAIIPDQKNWSGADLSRM